VNGERHRVARIITRLNIGGPSIQAINLSRDLRDRGFDTCLIHGRLGDGEGDMTTLLPIVTGETLYIDDLVRSVAPLRDLRALWRIYRALRRWRPHIVHTHMAKAGSLGRLAAHAYNLIGTGSRRARMVHTYHGHVFEGYFGSPSTRLFLAIERFLARRTDALIAISSQVRNDLLQTYGVATERQIHTIPLGFNLDRLLAIGDAQRREARAALEVPEGSIVVGTVGRLTAIKQHSLFLDMAGRLARRSDKYLFLVAGDGELRAALESQAGKHEIRGRTRFLGWRGDLDTIYGATDVFVLTSRNEGTPVALIEAMAAGVASVSTDVGGVRDVINSPELGALVPFGDTEMLANAVSALADAPSRREEIGRAARASVSQRFHAKRLINDIERLYWQLLENGGTIRS
jgi:glycosyltransferase involved in cell wall biosynthesis